MKMVMPTPVRYASVLLLGALIVSGCSSSSESATGGGTESTNNVPASSTGVPDSEEQNISRVNFVITVPVYVSNALQVRLIWGDIDLTANWISDEHWSVSADFPADTENLLIVNFNDDNGNVPLGSYEQKFRTGTNDTEHFQITADQFDTNRWDADGDGVSNINELIAGTNPLEDGSLESVQATLELVADKTFRISWLPAAGAEFYRVLENPDGVSGFTQFGGDLGLTIQSMDHRVALYKRVNARYVVQACNAQGCVDSDELIVSGSLERAIGYLKSSNADVGDNFSFGAVTISEDGTTLAVGASREDSAAAGVNGNQADNSAENSGAVYVFERINGDWIQQAYLKPSNTDSNDQFGREISLSGDGATLAVGASHETSIATGINGDQSDNSVEYAGAVYVFSRSSGNWQQQAYLKGDRNKQWDFFGSAVSLNHDGNTLAVGALGGGPSSRNGAAYVFVRDNETWQQQSYFKGGDVWAYFGSEIDLSADGNTLAVTTVGEYSYANINDKAAGAVSVYTVNNGSWELQTFLKASNYNDYDRFGSSISLSADGSTLAVGAPGESSGAMGVNSDQSDNSALDSGAVYIFGRSDVTWFQQAYVKAANAEMEDFFGTAVSLSADGDLLAVGAYREDGASTGINGDQSDNANSSSGAVYLFKHLDGVWQQHVYLKASNTDVDDKFGYAVSLSGNGDTLVVSANGEDSSATGLNGNQNDNTVDSAGAVYLY